MTIGQIAMGIGLVSLALVAAFGIGFVSGYLANNGEPLVNVHGEMVNSTVKVYEPESESFNSTPPYRIYQEG